MMPITTSSSTSVNALRLPRHKEMRIANSVPLNCDPAHTGTAVRLVAIPSMPRFVAALRDAPEVLVQQSGLPASTACVSLLQRHRQTAPKAGPQWHRRCLRPRDGTVRHLSRQRRTVGPSGGGGAVDADRGKPQGSALSPPTTMPVPMSMERHTGTQRPDPGRGVPHDWATYMSGTNAPPSTVLITPESLAVVMPRSSASSLRRSRRSSHSSAGGSGSSVAPMKRRWPRQPS